MAPPPSLRRDRFPNKCPRRYSDRSSAGSLFHQKKYIAATKTRTGMPMMTTSHRRAYKRKVIKYPMVHRFKVLGIRLVACASPTNQRNTRIAPITAITAATINKASILQCFLTNVLQICLLCSFSGSVIIQSLHPLELVITRSLYLSILYNNLY